MSLLTTPTQPDDTNLYLEEHVLLPGASAGPVSVEEINALVAAADDADRALGEAEAIAATPIVQTRVVRRLDTGRLTWSLASWLASGDWDGVGVE